jgi:hypothetical protein
MRYVLALTETYIAFGKLPAAAIGTAHFFATINNFFDLFSSKLKGPSCLQSAFTKASVQLQLLQECKHLFENLTVNTYKGGSNVTSTIKCIKGLLQCISAFPMLFDYLK